jgi:hypothetical protein
MDTIDRRLDSGFRDPGSLVGRCVEALALNDIQLFDELYEPIRNKGQPEYNKTPVLFDIELALFDAMLFGPADQGVLAARALAGWVRHLEPSVDRWRAGPAGDATGRWGSWHALGSYSLFGWHEIGLAYDFGYEFLNDRERADVRRVISKLTKGAYSFGMNLPPHLRSWNWINCGNYFGLLVLAIEGEEGYDERVYARSVEVMADYLHHNYSLAGSSTEPVGYTSFGYVWGAEALLAMARRGDNLLVSTPYLAVPNWQVQCLAPHGDAFYSFGDGGNHAPTFDELHLRKAVFPRDPTVDYLFQQVVGELVDDPDDYLDRRGRPFLAAALATDPDSTDHQFGVDLDLPTSWVDPDRGTLISRTDWSEDAIKFHIECRPDTFYAGHEHADRGHFVISAHGRTWAPDGFRSVESRYHSVVLIDGRGQGYFPPPGRILQIETGELADFLVCDQKYAYDWFYPKAILGLPLDHPKFQLERFAHFLSEAEEFQARFPGFEKDDHPNVVKAFDGVPLGDSGMWDEDPWSIRAVHNPVEFAFRTGGLIRGRHPYMLILDDIRKDGDEHLYEWQMMLQMDIVPLAIAVHDNPTTIGPRTEEVPDAIFTDVLLGSNRIERRGNTYLPEVGEPLLLVRILEASVSRSGPAFNATPQVRVETFEKKDYRHDRGGRSFGLDKRLVVPSRSVDPGFKILIYPHRYGDPLPETDYVAGSDRFEIRIGGQVDTVSLDRLGSGRTRLYLSREDKSLIDPVE